MQHSLVGGSTAKIILNCYGSLKLRERMPPQVENQYMAVGTLLHNTIDRVLSHNENRGYSLIGNMKYADQVLTKELLEEKVHVALDLLEQVDTEMKMEFVTEQRVGFGDLLPGVFGTSDLIGRIGNRAIVLDWKFGDGVPVDAEENEQGLFYAAAGMRTPGLEWAFKGADEVEIVIVQPPHIRRWVTTVDRVKCFEQDLIVAVTKAQQEGAMLKAGEHCRWCSAKPVCPVMTGAVDRALKVTMDNLPARHINDYLKQAELLEEWIKDIRALAFNMMDKGIKLDDWKLVAKRGTRKWSDVAAAGAEFARMGVEVTDCYNTELKSPAQMEKVLKKLKKDLPDDLVVSVSSGSMVAPKDDPRPELLQIGQQLSAALSKLV